MLMTFLVNYIKVFQTSEAEVKVNSLFMPEAQAGAPVTPVVLDPALGPWGLAMGAPDA